LFSKILIALVRWAKIWIISLNLLNSHIIFKFPWNKQQKFNKKENNLKIYTW